MTTIAPGTLLPSVPDKTDWPKSRIGRYLLDIERRIGRTFDTYEDAWRGSVDDLQTFWDSICTEFEIIEHTPHTAVLADRTMRERSGFPAPP
ncbi:hypothetical protein [Rhodococcus koreensis]|uniref:hypothetical protein n=1 Tax=Rhodococcus koreensis TaxID=99653 RepID=UPI00366DA0E3